MGAVRIPFSEGELSVRIVSKVEGSQKMYLQTYVLCRLKYFYD
jgi:hypothetical protein